MLNFYKFILARSESALNLLLRSRLRQGKENPARLNERRGIAGLPRPAGQLTWIHAASVGEAQSALILIDRLMKGPYPPQILLTTGTVTSAQMMQKNLPAGAIHQFYPLDHPAWVGRFLDHWQPELILWMESELWPNMLSAVKARGIPAVLVNARLSKRSFLRWKIAASLARQLLQTFPLILAQTREDAARYAYFGAPQIVVTDNLKYSAKPLPVQENDLKQTLAHIQGRPAWLYASSHKGEEALAARVHERLKAALPNLLTIIVPRHPSRRENIMADLQKFGLKLQLRGEDKILPQHDTDIYIADTMGELGLFYRAVSIALIGRSFSDDGGGGHNPIEAAQLNCAVLHGPRVQYQQRLFDDMLEAGACREIKNETELSACLQDLLGHRHALQEFQAKCLAFAKTKEKVIDLVMQHLDPFLDIPAHSRVAGA